MTLGQISKESFPRLRAGTFIEAVEVSARGKPQRQFPRLRAGTFIEAQFTSHHARVVLGFPRLRAGTFIEAVSSKDTVRLGKISPPSGGDFH